MQYSPLRRGLIVAAICCLIALALTLAKQGAWNVQLAYSLPIGMTCWLVIEAGRAALTRGKPMPWPQGWRGAALVATGVAAGFLLGTAIGDFYSGDSLGGLNFLRRHDAVVALLITVACGLAIAFFFYSDSQARTLQARIAQAQRDAAEARLKLLETQIEPHMLFNTLANLRALIATDPPSAQAMLDRLIAYLRATLGASRATLHPLADEFARLADYLALMAVRMGPRLSYTLELPEPLSAVPVPPLLLQPLVENAIRHGLEPQVAGGRIGVRASLAGGMLRLEVRDSGAGLAPGAADGFGLAQVRERLATLYGSRGTLELIAVTAGGACAAATFPL
ncbi:histidine kinase [Ramlibacter sp. H39-3-26]|uniref:sensor histidine kinase n=1 Tax=Curvibacter soli TaxID=3031331 RepID=UPI0023DA8DE4|nr:histidine kinase [Ramlibacter sp. H39-3-26]MDF1485537.1 histidine kinase [Ramlibacter sp. H39-3-26]